MEPSLRILIADDEPPARLRVRTLLRNEPGAEIVAECADGAATVAAIAEHRPDLVFLDVQMPRLDGFGVLEVLGPEAMPVVIFTTAHDEHAVRAFEVNALDYLLKPFKESRFRQALERARLHLRARREGGSDNPLAALLAHLRTGQAGGPRLLVKLPDRIFFLRADQIDHIESAGNYVVVHTGSERHVVRETMAALEQRLVGTGFLRLSRSVLVNLHRIRELQPMGASEYCVILKNGARLAMTCSLREIQQRMAAL
jgi:two-component system LytT family response regulator